MHVSLWHAFVVPEWSELLRIPENRDTAGLTLLCVCWERNLNPVPK